jgi:hypothetical protein
MDGPPLAGAYRPVDALNGTRHSLARLHRADRWAAVDRSSRGFGKTPYPALKQPTPLENGSA